MLQETAIVLVGPRMHRRPGICRHDDSYHLGRAVVGDGQLDMRHRAVVERASLCHNREIAARLVIRLLQGDGPAVVVGRVEGPALVDRFHGLLVDSADPDLHVGPGFSPYLQLADSRHPFQETDSGEKPVVAVSHSLRDVHVYQRVVAGRADHDASLSGQLVNHLVAQRRPVVGAHLRSQAHVYDSRLVDLVCVVEDEFYGVGNPGVYIFEGGEHKVCVICHPVVGAFHV